MEENSKDIQCLIKLKKQRPSFSRMISWELSQASDTQFSSKVKQKKKQKTKCGTEQENAFNQEVGQEEEDDVEGESTQSSDYETANEDVIDEMELSGAFSSINTETSFDTADVADENDLDSDEDLQIEDDCFEAKSTNSSAGGLQPGRRRRLSKRQKKKRSKLFRVTYLDEFANLGDLFNMDNDIVTAFTDEIQGSIDICNPVPTLAELCLKATRQRKKRNPSGQNTSSSTPLPTGIKRMMTDWRINQRELDKQLSFLLNFVLPSCCETNNIKQYIVYYLNCNPSNTNEFEFRPPIRSVWCSFTHPVGKETGFQYPSERATAFLYNCSMRMIPEETLFGINDFHEREYLQKVCVSSTNIHSAFATTIDLMLPSTLSDRSRHSSSSTDSEVIERGRKTAVIRVKNALRSRYPHLVEHLFERVLPYVMWARGNVGHAAQLFQALIQKESNSQYKAMYLSEIACMHAMFGESSTAVSFYKLASEVALADEAVSSDKAITEVMEQKQVLQANVFDSGLLSAERSGQSLHHWGAALIQEQPKLATVMAAVDAYLGLHLGHLADDCWCEAESRLRAWLPANKYLLYYISLVLALKGNATDSTMLFREFRLHAGISVPGEMILPYLEKIEKRNPWNPLIAIVKGQRVPVRPLKVIWRTKLRPPRLTNEKPMEADVSSPKLNLCLSENGHLTGDLQMLMPPLRQVEMDLYTGSLVLTNVPSYTGTWQSQHLPSTDYSIENFLVPTPFQIFSHEDGTQVHLVCPSLKPTCLTTHLPRCPAVLTWRGPNGQIAKINLVTVAKEAAKKNLYQKLKSNNLLVRNHDPWKNELLSCLIEAASEKKLCLSVKGIESAAVNIISQVKQKRKKEAKIKQQRDPKNQKEEQKKKMDACEIKAMIPKNLSSYLAELKVDVEEEPFQFGRCLVLRLCIEDSRYTMFVDTSSRESFLNYNLVPSSGEIKQCRPGTNSTDANFFMGFKDSSVQIHNEQGYVVDTFDITHLDRDSHPDRDLHLRIIGGYLFGVTKCRLNIWRHTIGIDLSEDLSPFLAPYWELPDEKKQIEGLQALGREMKGKGQFLFLHMSMGLGFMDPDTFEMIPISLPEDSPLQLTEDCRVILGNYEVCTVHGEKFFTEDNQAMCRFAISTENKVLLMEMRHQIGSDQLQARMLCYLFLPGIAKEVCFVGKEVGVLVSVTQCQETDNYREHVLFFNLDGLLRGVLLCLGHGPRSFFPVYLPGSQDGIGEPGWYVYMRDGHDGILGVKLI